jgi:hypothetical protein
MMDDMPERDIESAILDATILVAELIDDVPPKAVKEKLRALFFEAQDFGARAAWAEVAELIAEHRP